MNSGDMISIFLNLAVGAYFAFVYPRSVKKRFQSAAQVPRGFVLLRRVIPAVGYLIMVMTLAYALALIMGWTGTGNG